MYCDFVVPFDYDVSGSSSTDGVRNYEINMK